MSKITGWLKDKDGNDFAPATVLSQVFDSNGNSLASIIDGVTEYTEITSQVEFNEDVTGINCHIYIKNGQIQVLFQGENKSRSTGQVLFTLPAAYMPKFTTYHPCVVNGLAYGVLELNYNGVCKINFLSSTITGRVYASFEVPLKE